MNKAKHFCSPEHGGVFCKFCDAEVSATHPLAAAVPNGWVIDCGTDDAKIVSPIDGPGVIFVAKEDRPLSNQMLFALAKALAAPQNEAGEPVARMHPDDGRVIPESTYATGARDGGSSWSSVRPYTIKLYATPQASPPQARVPLTEEQIEAGRRDTFSTENPFCPCDSKTMRKAVRWAERAHLIGLETKE